MGKLYLFKQKQNKIKWNQTTECIIKNKCKIKPIKKKEINTNFNIRKQKKEEKEKIK